MDIKLTSENNITTGKVYKVCVVYISKKQFGVFDFDFCNLDVDVCEQHVLEKERKGDYLGKTVQVSRRTC